jgi:hypothetical protein
VKLWKNVERVQSGFKGKGFDIGDCPTWLYFSVYSEGDVPEATQM